MYSDRTYTEYYLIQSPSAAFKRYNVDRKIFTGRRICIEIDSVHFKAPVILYEAISQEKPTLLKYISEGILE